MATKAIDGSNQMSATIFAIIWHEMPREKRERDDLGLKRRIIVKNEAPLLLCSTGTISPTMSSSIKNSNSWTAHGSAWIAWDKRKPNGGTQLSKVRPILMWSITVHIVTKDSIRSDATRWIFPRMRKVWFFEFLSSFKVATNQPTDLPTSYSLFRKMAWL